MKNIFSVDAETDGLYGSVFAIGAIVVAPNGTTIAEFAGHAPYPTHNAWLMENCIPHLADLPEYADARALRDAFWEFWMVHKDSALCIAECGSPVESGLFRACVADDPDARQWNGPFPMHEVATLLEILGIDPVGYSGIEYAGLKPAGLKRHNPLDDAFVSAQVWAKAQAEIRAKT